MKDYSKNHKRAWECNAYDFWVSTSGHQIHNQRDNKFHHKQWIQFKKIRWTSGMKKQQNTRRVYCHSNKIASYEYINSLYEIITLSDEIGTKTRIGSRREKTDICLNFRMLFDIVVAVQWYDVYTVSACKKILFAKQFRHIKFQKVPRFRATIVWFVLAFWNFINNQH